MAWEVAVVLAQVYIYIHTYIHMYIYRMCVCVCVCVCVYVYVYVYTHTHTLTYICHGTRQQTHECSLGFSLGFSYLAQDSRHMNAVTLHSGG